MLAEARQQLFEILSSKFTDIIDGDDGAQHPVAVLSGGQASTFEFFDTDTNFTYFRQEPFFRYIFGVNEPDCMGLIDFKAKEFVLFVPDLPPSSYRWNGVPHAHEKYTAEYGVTATFSVRSKQRLRQLPKPHPKSATPNLTHLFRSLANR